MSVLFVGSTWKGRVNKALANTMRDQNNEKSFARGVFIVDVFVSVSRRGYGAHYILYEYRLSFSYQIMLKL